MALSAQDAKTLARLRREDDLRDKRDGRVRRAHTIPSGKQYTRRKKHKNRQFD